MDEINKNKTQKLELQDNYYGQMIDYTKYQYLVSDIKWMTEIKERLTEKENERLRRKEEQKEQQDRYKKEKEDFKRKELEQKQRELDRQQAQHERKQKEEESFRQSEIDHLAKLNEALNDNSLGSNPLFEQIEQCEFLERYCQKKMKSQIKAGDEVEGEAQAEETKEAIKKSELDKALAKGSIQLAPSKESKAAVSVFNALVGSKK